MNGPAVAAPSDEQKIVDSWHRNVPQWTAAVRDGQIESRRLVTDAAVVEAVLSFSPSTVLDVGCGEGWLARRLAEAGAMVTGVDVVPELVARAQSAGGGDFRVLAYAEVEKDAFRTAFDAVVCNFSLLGNTSVDTLLRAVPSLLHPDGVLVVQTLHPLAACGDQPYRDGWREGSWAGFSSDFTDPPPWYFRTLESWLALLAESGLRLVSLREPVHPQTGKPASVILVARLMAV
jgi:2-polyprenyl-3-methyl-5-hydroxy-6-metoxy-1,4-benzoquinol methylase